HAAQAQAPSPVHTIRRPDREAQAEAENLDRVTEVLEHDGRCDDVDRGLYEAQARCEQVTAFDDEDRLEGAERDVDGAQYENYEGEPHGLEQTRTSTSTLQVARRPVSIARYGGMRPCLVAVS